MVRIEEGGVYKAKRVRWGENDRGRWELVVVAGDKGRQEITIFPENVPSGVKEDAMFTVDKIHACEVKVQKNPDKTWGKEKTRVEAEINPCLSFDPFGELSAQLGIDDGLEL